jgi:hypothetical protein
MTRLLRIFALVLVMSLAAALWAEPNITATATATATTGISAPLAVPHRTGHHLDELLFVETWESGFPHGWETVDLTAVSGSWHLDTYQAFGGAGTSWWVGDPAIGPNGGYGDGWYMNLQTPSMTLPAGTPTMRFWQRYAIEPPPTSTQNNYYDGWDGLNLRISTNNGLTWNIIPAAALNPTYSRDSLYSFGVQHCEGYAIPGWCGTDSVWHLQTVNLSAWAGQSVKIRFAFASDPNWSTVPDHDWAFGWMIDQIRCYAGTDTFFSDDCSSVGSWAVSTGRSAGGNLWRVAQDSDPNNGTMVLVCNNAATGLYNPGMDNAIMSPYIDLRTIGFGTVFLDMRLKGNVLCPDVEDETNCDAWGCEVTVDSGRTWCAINNAACDTSITSYRYVGEWGTEWGWASTMTTDHPWQDLYQFHGQVIRFRLYHSTGCDPNVAEGVAFDSITVTYTQGFQNDVTCNTMQVCYPNMVNRPFRIRAYFANPGQNAQNDIGSWYRYIPNGLTWRAMGLPFDLAHGATATRDTLVTVTTQGIYQFQARSSLTSDMNTPNDTANVEGVQVLPGGTSLDIGYDNHILGDTYYYFPRFATGEGPLVYFTVVSDHVVNTFNLQEIKMQFTDQQTTENMPIRMHIYKDRIGGGLPGVEIYTADIAVGLVETGTSVWKTETVSADPDTRNMNTNFWVWLETTNTGAEPRWPAIIADVSHGWSDIHHYTWGGTSTSPEEIDNYFQLHAVLDDLSSADNPAVELPAAWSLEQNYPNPFNPTTEIQFAVPRSEYVTLKVFNLLGQEVATLVDGRMEAGIHHATFDGANLASGVYLYRLESVGFSAVHKMLLMK